MKHIFSLSFMILALSACSTPQTKEEFQDFAPSSMYLGHQTFVVEDTSAADMKSRVKEFANKCLTVHTEMTCKDIHGLPCGHAANAYTPTFVDDENRVTLYLQWLRESGSASFNKVPPKGDFVMMVDVKPEGNKKWAGSVHTYRGFGDLSDDAIKWISGGKKLCPSLQ